MAGHMTLQQQFESGLSHHQAGRLAEAERIYRQILSQQPNHADATHLLGVLARQAGRLDAGIELMRRAIRLKPDLAAAHCNLGNALQGKGQLDEAIASYRRAIALNPNLPEANSNLGNALKAKGQLDEAIAACRQAIALRPNYAEAHINLGNALKDKGQLDEAIAAYRRAIALRGNYAEAHSNLGTALRDKGQLDEAIAAYRQAVFLRPNYPEVHNNLGVARKDKGQVEEAIADFRRAIALRPDYAEAHNNLGGVLKTKGQLDEAIASYRQAIRFNPDLTEAHYNLGNALREIAQLNEAIASYRQAIRLKPGFADAHGNLGIALRSNGQLDEAIAAYRQALALSPNLPEAHHNLSLAILARGDFQQGWEEYEWRWKCKDFPPPRNFAQPQWDGCPLEGRTLLVHTDQGLGDGIQFIRYLPLAAQRGGRIILECHAELQRLFQTIAGRCQIVVRGQPLPAFDLHCPLLSLPRVFRTNLANIPKDVPYLHADVEGAKRWQQRLASHSPMVKVGLAWAGSPIHKNDRDRSMKLARLAPLGQVPGARFFSLQKGEAAAEAKSPPPGMELVDWTQELKDFADTAALIDNLDLVIAVDTAVAHLAGAMGKPVWTLLPFASDWRWLLQRQDSPWYPSMRLFRQPCIGDWDSIIVRVVDTLALWIEKPR
jgi:tetratricopeptide (TPR) repeat protein